ncbi:hypothetical protein Tco_0808911 [Tanacetum coccineum]
MNEDVMGAVEEKLSKIRAATKEGTSGSLSESLPHTIEAIHFYNGMAKFSPSISKEICGGKKEDVGLDELGEGGKGVVSKIEEFGGDLGSELLGDRGGEEDERRFIVI